MFISIYSGGLSSSSSVTIKSNESSPRAAFPNAAAASQPTPAPMVAPATAAVYNNNVPTNSVPAPAPASAPSSKKVEYAIALYDNEVDDDEELAFTQGQRIEVLEKDDTGWYKGRLDGRVGLFPINYVKLE